jgi:fumarate hydratase class I
MTIIRQDDFIQSIADALQYISYYHPLDFIQALNGAYQKEQSPAAKDAMAQILNLFITLALLIQYETKW